MAKEEKRKNEKNIKLSINYEELENIPVQKINFFLVDFFMVDLFPSWL